MDKEKFAVMQELLIELAELQSIRGTAPIELSIGWTNKGTVVDNEVIIKSAPPKVVQELVEKGYCLEVRPEGVRVFKI